MNQFTFDSKLKTGLIGFMILGLVCMGITFFTDDALHTRFWTNFLHNSVYFTGMGFIATFVIAAFTTAYAGWYVVMKRVWESFSLFLIPGLVLMGIMVIGLLTGMHHIYHWADPQAVAGDEILQGKSGFLNKGWYSLGTFAILGTWVFFAWKFRQISLDEDRGGGPEFAQHFKLRSFSAIFLPIAAFSSAAVIWQWTMSIDSHWYSTLYAWYTTASWFDGTIALLILTIIFLKSRGYMQALREDHLHDLGKYMFAFSVFWTYLWFSQYMLIWYGNIGEETIYFRERLDNYRVLFFANLVINFALPFIILMPNTTKRKYGTLVLTSIIVFFGHWLDFFLMIKPGAYLTAQEHLAHHGADHGAEAGAHGVEEAAHQVSNFAMGFTIPGLLELGTMLGFLGLFAYFILDRLSKAPLIPENDPYIGESLHHAVEPPYGDGGHH